MFFTISHFPMNPAAISSQAVPSFVIFNIPDRKDLANMDSDLDGLSDDEELFGETFTSPFLSDTDDDQYSDYCEHTLGSDPNDPLSVPTKQPLVAGRTPTIDGIQLRVPNPLGVGATVAFRLPAAGPAQLSVFDVQGRLLRALVSGEMEAGDHLVSWDGKDSQGQPLRNGVYFWALNTAGQHETRKILLTR